MTSSLKLTVAFTFVMAAGCSDSTSDIAVSSPPAPGGSPTVPDPPPEDSANANSGDVSLELADLAAIQKTIAEAGKPVVVDFWSTSCIPCMEEFHGLVELHDQHSDDLMCVSVCIDYIGVKSKPPETYQEDVLKFLKSQKATLTNFLSTTADSDVYDTLDLASIPAVIVYAGDGTVSKRFVDTGEGNAFTYKDDVTPMVESLLKP